MFFPAEGKGEKLSLRDWAGSVSKRGCGDGGQGPRTVLHRARRVSRGEATVYSGQGEAGNATRKKKESAGRSHHV